MSPVWRARASPSWTTRTIAAALAQPAGGHDQDLGRVAVEVGDVAAQSTGRVGGVELRLHDDAASHDVQPPAKRRVDATSAFRQQGLVTSSLLSSSFTFAVIAMRSSCHPCPIRPAPLVRPSLVPHRLGPLLGPAGPGHDQRMSRYAAASRRESWCPGQSRLATGATTTVAPSLAAALRRAASSSIAPGSASTTSSRSRGAWAARVSGGSPPRSRRSPPSARR